jgi:hypothetical protein
MTTKLEDAEERLRFSIASIVTTLSSAALVPVSHQRLLAWAGSELERLAGEACRLADEADDDPGASPLVIGLPAMAAVPMRDIHGMDHATLRATHPEIYEDPCREPIPGFQPKDDQ